MPATLVLLKEKIMDLYDTFINESIDAFKIAEVKNLLWVLRPLNEIGKRQIEVLCEFFGRDIEDRACNGRWSKEYLDHKKVNMESALDIVMEMGYVV